MKAFVSYFAFLFEASKKKYIVLSEMEACRRAFYSYPRILRRVLRNSYDMRRFISSLVINLSLSQNTLRSDREAYLELSLAEPKPKKSRYKAVKRYSVCIFDKMKQTEIIVT